MNPAIGTQINNTLNNYYGITQTTTPTNLIIDNASLKPKQNNKKPIFAADISRIPAGITSSGVLKPLRIGRPSYYLGKLSKPIKESKLLPAKSKLPSKALPSIPEPATKPQQEVATTTTETNKNNF